MNLCLLFILISASIIIHINSFKYSLKRSKLVSCFSNKKSEQEEQLRIQKEILARRKNPKAKAELFDKVEKRRISASETMKKTLWAEITKYDIDPLEKWKVAKTKGEIKDLGYEKISPVDEKKESIFGFSIPIIQSPIDIPSYDNGQRFDLRLPYAERVYEDPEADFMGKLLNFFSAGKKKS